MATYTVEAPNRSLVSVQCKIGSFQFNHGDQMYDDKLASFFPSIFRKTSDGVPASQVVVEEVFVPTVDEIVAPVETKIEDEIVPESIQETSLVEEISEPEQEVVEEIASQESIQEDESVEEVEEESIEGDYQEEDNSETTPVTFVGKKRGRKAKGN